MTAPSADAAGAAVARVVRGGLWSLAAYAGEGGSLFAVSVILGRSLGPASFGRYSFFLWLFRMLPTLLALGVPVALAKMVPEALGAGDGSLARGYVRLAARFHAVLLVVPLGIAATVAVTSGNLLLAGLLVLGTAASLAVLDIEAVLTGLRDFRLLSVFAFASGGLQVGAAVAGWATGASWEGFLVLLVGAGLIGLAGLSAVCRARLRHLPPPALEPDDRRRFVRFAAVTTATIAVDAVLWGRPELLFLKWTSTDGEVGYYSAALRIAGLVSVLPLIASRAMIPEFSRLRGADDTAGLKAAYPEVCRLLAVVAAPLAAIGATLAPAAVALVYGSEFGPAGTATAILVAGTFANGIAGATSAAVLTGPRPRLAAELGAVAVVANLALDAVLVPAFGAIGAAAATVGIQASSVLVGIVYSWRWLGLPYPVAEVSRTCAVAAAAAAVAGLVARGEGPAALMAGGAFGALAYLVLGLLAGAVDPPGLRRALTGEVST